MERKEICIKVEGMNIRGLLFLPKGDPPFPILCISHGIPAQRAKRDEEGYPLLAERFCKEGFATLIFNFRGTGWSQGNFDILGWTRDLKALIDYLLSFPGLDQNRLNLLGFSGGAAVSVYVASHERQVSSLAICSCPANFKELGKVEDILEHARSVGIIREEGFPQSMEKWFSGFDEVAPERWISMISPRPLLIVHGLKDELVPVSHAKRLYELSGKPKRLVVIEEGLHRLRTNEKAIETISQWLLSLKDATRE